MPIQLHRLPYYSDSFIKLLLSSKLSSLPVFFTDLVWSKPSRRMHFKVHDLRLHYKTFLDLLVLKEVICDREYESFGLRVSFRDRVVVDIGAGFGDFSILIAKRFPRVKVYAFEPDKSYYSLLVQNIKKNTVHNVFPICKAVKNAAAIFRYTKVSAVDFLKMDCEGGEFSIINRGSRKYLPKIKKMVLEYHETDDYSAKSLRQILRGCDFKVRLFPRGEVPKLGILTARRTGSVV